MAGRGDEEEEEEEQFRYIARQRLLVGYNQPIWERGASERKMCLFLEPRTFGEAQSTGNGAMGSWDHLGTDAILKNELWKSCFRDLRPCKRG